MVSSAQVKLIKERRVTALRGSVDDDKKASVVLCGRSVGGQVQAHVAGEGEDYRAQLQRFWSLTISEKPSENFTKRQLVFI